MASLKKRGDSWQATIYVGRDENGKQLFEYLTRPTLKECKAAAREREQEIEDGNYSSAGNAKVTTLIREYLELNKDNLSPSTIATYEIYLKAHYEPFFKNKKAKQVKEIDIRKFMARQLEYLSPTTVRKHISVLNKILEQNLKNKNPAKYVELPKKAKFTPKVLTNKEFMKIHIAAKKTSLRDEIIVLLAGWCGMRRSEIFALKPDDIFKNKKLIRVDEGYVIDNESRYVDKGPKSDNGYRYVAVPNYLMNLIQEYMRGLGEIPERLFDFRPDYWSERFQNVIIRKNNLPSVRFHDLRHYHASWLYKNGILDHKAADRIGDDIRTLKQVYQHIGAEDSDKLDEEIRQKLETTMLPFRGQKKIKRYKLKRTM